MISSRSLAKHPPRLLELILLEMVVDSMIIRWLQASAKVITTPPLIHSHVLRGSSCRAGTVPPANHQNLQPLLSNDVLLPRSNAWFHVYSKRNANSSLCTQCAAIAHLPVRQFCRAKNKFQKQQCLLREVVPSSDQVTFSSADIDQEIIVFDGGNSGCPMITPPKKIN